MLQENSKTKTNWPFKYYNGVQTEESKKLEQQKFVHTKDYMEDLGDGLF